MIRSTATLHMSRLVMATLLLATVARAQEQKDDRLALYLAELETGKVSLVTAEPAVGHAYCGSPDLSPDGKFFFLDATPGKEWSKTRIFGVEFPVTEELRFLNYGPGNCPAWSPDGKRIAFLLNQDAVPGAQPGIYTMTPEGKERRRLAGFGMPEWSPDGKSILAISFSNPTTLSLIDVATRKEQAITLLDHTIHSVPAWAGDSQTLIAVIRAEGLAKIALLDITDPAAAKIKKISWARDRGADPEPTYPVYEPETGRIAFVGRTSQGSSLFMVDAKSGSTPRQVEPGRYDPRIASLEFAPGGKQLLFCAERTPGDKKPVRQARIEPPEAR